MLLLGCVGSDVMERPFLMAQVPRSRSLTARPSAANRPCILTFPREHALGPWPLEGGAETRPAPQDPQSSPPGPQGLDILSLVSPSSWRRQQTARRRESKWFRGSWAFLWALQERAMSLLPHCQSQGVGTAQAARTDRDHVCLPVLCRGQQSCSGQSSVRAILLFRDSALPLTLAV